MSKPLTDEYLGKIERFFTAQARPDDAPFEFDGRSILDLVAEVRRLRQCLDTWERAAAGTEEHVRRLEDEISRLREESREQLQASNAYWGEKFDGELAVIQRAMDSLCPVWTKDQPTVAGWYGWRSLPECKAGMYLVTFGAGKWWVEEGGFGTDGETVPIEELAHGEWTSKPYTFPE